MTALVPFQVNTPIGQTNAGEDVYVSRAFVDYLMAQLFNFLGGTSGTIPVGNIDLGGDGDATHFLNGAGSYITPGYPVSANPISQVATSAINGSAATFMRSDAAPALNVGITPTWSGLHTFGAGISTTFIAAGGAVTGGTFTAALGFGCNGKAAQASATVSAAVAGTAGATYTATEQGIINANATLTNQIRTALIANGITV